MRILNRDRLVSHGNVAGRQVALDILEAGLQAADPYEATLKLLRVEGNRLVVGNHDYEPTGSPRSGDEVYDLSKVGRIFVFGAGKGIQYVARAIEDVLGNRLTGGCVIPKHGDDLLLSRIKVIPGAHPVPDDGCAEGCRKIIDMSRGLTRDDLVFTIAGNGVSSLLTLPVPDVSMEDVRQTTYIMQIERGAPTGDLNQIRNHLDMMKGGRISRYLQPARAIHLIAVDPSSYDQLMHRNLWLHTLPDATTFEGAVAMLKKWSAWDDVPASVRQHLIRADPAHETVKAAEFEGWDYRIFGVMPNHLSMVPAAMRRAEELGYRAYKMSSFLHAEASQVGLVMADIARNVEREGQPFRPPCALFATGEMLVTVGKEKGIGGRNQEYALSASRRLEGSPNVVMASADSDGTDGPGTQFVEGCEGVPQLAGGIVDGQTAAEAREKGIDIVAEIRKHNSTVALCQLDSGIAATHNISVNDLGVTLVMGRG